MEERDIGDFEEEIDCDLVEYVGFLDAGRLHRLLRHVDIGGIYKRSTLNGGR